MPIPRNKISIKRGGTGGAGDGWHGFEDITVSDVRNLSLELIGPEQTGKTLIGFSMPDPTAYFNMDRNEEAVVASPAFKARLSKKTIKQMTFEIPKGLVANAKLQTIAEAERDRCLSNWTWACESDKFRSIFMDVGTDFWELWRYAEFGQESSRARNYGPLNSQFSAMLRMPRKCGKNLIITNRTKDLWKDDKPTGKIIRDGFKNTGYAMHATIETMRDEYDNFSIQLRDVRHDPALNGKVFTPDDLGGELSFAMIACQIIEGSTPDEWE